MRNRKLLIGVFGCTLLAIVAVLVIRSRRADPDRILSRADKHFAAEEFDSARIEYTKLIQLDSSNAYPFQQIAYGLLDQGLAIRALPFLARSVELDPKNSKAKLKFAGLVLSLGDRAGGNKLANEVLDANPISGEALLLLANTSQPKNEEEIAQIRKRLASFDEQKHACFHLATAILASREGAGLEAVKASLDRALELEPESVSVHLARSSYFEATGDKEGLVESLEKAAELSPLRSVLRIRYANVLNDAGDPEKAKQILEELTDKAPDFVPAWNQLAEIAIAQQDYDGALGFVEKVLAKDGQNYAAQMTKVQALLAKEDSDAAIKLLEKLDENYPAGFVINKFQIKMTLGRVHAKFGDLDQAIADFEEALGVIPGAPEAVIALARLNLGSGTEIGLAATSLENLLERRPDQLEAEALLALAYRGLGRLEAAAEIYRKQIARDESVAGPHFFLGVVLRELEKPDEAYLALGTAQQLAPDDQSITLQLIALDIAKKDFASAHARAQVHVDKPEIDQVWGGHYLHGQIYMSEKNWGETEKALLKALELKPEAVNVYDLLVQSYIAAEDQPQAISRLEEYLQSNPKSTRHRMLLALLQEKQDDLVAAGKSYEEMLANNADFIPALNNLAYLNSEVFDQIDKARALAERAHALSPNDPGITDTLGWIYYKQGDYAKALGLIQQAADQATDQPEIQFHLGLARAKMGQDEAARVALQKAVSSEAEFRGKEEAAARLAQLGAPAAEQTLETLEAQVADRPDDLIARIQLASLYEGRGDAEKAKGAYEAAIAANPDLLPAIAGLARLYAGPLDDLAKAQEFSERARSLSPDEPATIAARGLVALRQGDFGFAYDLLKKAMPDQKIGSMAPLQLAFGRAAYGCGRLADARQSMTRVVDPDVQTSSAAKAEAASFLALTEDSSTGNSAAMQVAAQQRLELDRENLPALMLMASIESDDPAAAVEIYQTILARLKGFVPAQKELAIIYARDPGKRDEALKLAQAVRTALPDDTEIVQTFGILTFHRGDETYAIQLLKPLEEKNALDAEGQFYLGMSYLKAEQNQKASAALQRALDAGLSEPLAEQAKDALEQAKNALEPTDAPE